MSTLEEFEATLELISERRIRWNQTAAQAGHQLIADEATLLAGPLTDESRIEITRLVAMDVDQILCADLQYGRDMRRFLFTDDEQAYTTQLHNVFQQLIPGLVPSAVQRLNLQTAAAPEPEKVQTWIN